ncbi:MAG: porin family protein [Prevotella sp.]
MKRYFLSFLISILCLHTYAQNAYFAITGGLNLSHPTGYEMRWGYNIGLKGDLMFSTTSNIYFSPLLRLSKKGWQKTIYDLDENRSTLKCNLYYIDLPLLFGYKFPLNTTSNLFVEMGPYIGIGVFGKAYSQSNDYATDNLFKSDLYKRFDCGLSASVGIDIKKWQMGISYNHGMIKPTHGAWNEMDPKNQTIIIYTSFYFNR